MLESLLVIGLVALVSGVAAVAFAFGWITIALGGLVCAAVGLILGVPTGVYYHVALYRCLTPRGVLPARWWWNPTKYHRYLTIDEQRLVMRWFYAGGAGFGLVVLGGVLTFVGVMLAA